MSDQADDQALRALPFVSDAFPAWPECQGVPRRCFWAVTPPESYEDGCNLGESFAREFIRYLQNVGDDIPVLPWIVSDMSVTHDDSHAGSRGVIVGFLTVLHRRLGERLHG